MTDQNQAQKIIVSDHFDIDSVVNLFEEFVDPFKEKISESDLVTPRRLLGNYLTYLVTDANNTISIMVKKHKNDIYAQCTCKDFQKNEKCKHVAIVLISMQKQIYDELKEKKASQAALEKSIKKNEEALLFWKCQNKTECLLKGFYPRCRYKCVLQCKNRQSNSLL